MHLYEVLRRPLITEKNTTLQTQSKYVFEVDARANKNQVKQAVEKVFKVEVLSVNMMTVPGKTKRVLKIARRNYHILQFQGIKLFRKQGGFVFETS